MTVQASKPMDPVQPPANAQRAPGRRQPDAADNGFAQLLKGQTAKPTPDKTSPPDSQASGDQDTPDKGKTDKDKPRADAKTADAHPGAHPAPRPTDKPEDPAGQPSWWLALQAQRTDAATPAAADASSGAGAGSGAGALAALRDAAGVHAKAGREAQRADATLASTDKASDKAGVADKAHKGATPLGLVDLSEAGLAGHAARHEAVTDRAAAPSDGSLPSLTGLLATPAAAAQHHGLAAASAAAASTEARLPMPPDHPAFPQALGVQLSTWLRDGVEHARLELHPADLGPIDVRIAVTGGQTRVDLNADVAATRVALAQAIPQLAEVLGDVGLALSGSSVSAQMGQTGQNGQGGHGADATSRGRDGARGPAGRGGLSGVGGLGGGGGLSTKVVHHQGLLDLYA